MIKSSIEKIAFSIGYDIAFSDDTVQSDLLNGLASGLTKMNNHDMDMQICYMTEHLTKEAFTVIKQISGFVDLKEKEQGSV